MPVGVGVFLGCGLDPRQHTTLVEELDEWRVAANPMGAQTPPQGVAPGTKVRRWISSGIYHSCDVLARVETFAQTGVCAEATAKAEAQCR